MWKFLPLRVWLSSGKCRKRPSREKAAARTYASVSATLTAANKYDLTYIVRGAYGTEANVAAHPAGTNLTASK